MKKIGIIIMALVSTLREQSSMSAIRLPYKVAKALMDKHPEETAHLRGEVRDHESALLPTGAKLVKTKRKGRTAWFLSCYSYDNMDGRKMLMRLVQQS